MNLDQFNGHTQGPWKVKACVSGGGLLIREENSIQGSNQIVPMEDAQLIAAAPELLEYARKLEAENEEMKQLIKLQRVTAKMTIIVINRLRQALAEQEDV